MTLITEDIPTDNDDYNMADTNGSLKVPTDINGYLSDDVRSIRSTHSIDSTISPSLRSPERDVHHVPLSCIEYCMPHAYIRVCLAYRISSKEQVDPALDKLRKFVRKLVDAKPYLSGHLVPASDSQTQHGRVEIRFADEEFLNYPCIQIRRYTKEEMHHSYDELHQMGFPPSLIPPKLVCDLPEGADEMDAPILRVQANVLDGGIVVAFYLHHCISDGTGMGLLVSGAVLNDRYTFKRELDDTESNGATLNDRLNIYAKRKTFLREALSWSDPNRISARKLLYKTFGATPDPNAPKQRPGRGCIFELSFEKLMELRTEIAKDFDGELSKHVSIMSLLWHSMSRARVLSLPTDPLVRRSKLLIPTNIRERLNQPLDANYFGSAVDFAETQMLLPHLQRTDPWALAMTAKEIKQAVAAVDDTYIRASIALANRRDCTIDVRDLQAANMNRVTGADLYITSWWRQPLYSCDLEMGLGRPEWIRKPWSKDPGSCIILPQDDRRPVMEVLVQMTELDMSRLLGDRHFMRYVNRVIE